MKAKLTIFVLSVFLLWSSLLAVSHHNNFSKHREIKVATEFVSKAIVPSEDVIWKKSPSQGYTVLINFALANVHAWLEPLDLSTSFTQKSVKYYLLFRVLRN